MAKALGLLISAVVLEGRILLGAIVPSELEDSLAVAGLVVLCWAILAFEAEEVQVEPCTGCLVCSEEFHANDVLIELERLLSVLDTKHSVVLVSVSICKLEYSMLSVRN